MDLTTFTPFDASRLPTILGDLPAGTRVTLAPGDYILSEPIDVRANITIRGTPGRTRLLGKTRQLLRTSERCDQACFFGLTFEGGNSVFGGALSVRGGSSVVLDQCAFLRNHAGRTGGAIDLKEGASATITRCIFEQNTANGGGAIATTLGGVVVAEGCLFVRNRAEVGGAVLLRAASALKLVHCTFVDNVASWPAGGGALFVLARKTVGASAFIANCVFRGREAIRADTTKAYRVFFVSSIVPPESVAQSGFENVHGNTLAIPQLLPLTPNLFALDRGAPGSGTADPKHTNASALDLRGRPLVRDGQADPGALAAV